MKLIQKSTLLVLMAVASVSYGEGQKCSFQLNKDSGKVGWTAFKTSEKVGVKGTFKKVTLEAKPEADSLSKALDGTEVSVDKLSVDTTNPARDTTLTDFFFKKLHKSISAKVKSVSEKDSTLVVSLDLNGHKKDVTLHYDLKDDGTFSAAGNIDILGFGAKAALASLHQQCSALHTGKDGVSKTWPDVDVNFNATVTKTCK